MVLQEVFSVFYKINPTFSIAFDADHASACSFNNNPYKLCKAMPERNLCLYKIVQFEKFSLYEELYNDLNATRAVSGDMDDMDDVMGNLFCKVLFNMAHGFEKVCAIILDSRG